jgi:alginate O-acetyltransferase complex protein AlgI
MLFTFVLVCFAWIFFRAPDIQTALEYCGQVFSNIGSSAGLTKFLPGLLLIVPFLIIKWVNRAYHNGYMSSLTPQLDLTF